MQEEESGLWCFIETHAARMELVPSPEPRGTRDQDRISSPAAQPCGHCRESFKSRDRRTADPARELFAEVFGRSEVDEAVTDDAALEEGRRGLGLSAVREVR